jgi:hypothetical protein
MRVSTPMRNQSAATSAPGHILPFNNLALAKNQLPAIILGFVSRDPVGESAVQVDVLCLAVRYRAFVMRLHGVSSLPVERRNLGSRFCWRGFARTRRRDRVLTVL